MIRCTSFFSVPLAALMLFATVVQTGCSRSGTAKGFVSLVDGRFVIDGRPFFPMVMNYNVSLMSDGKQVWPASYSGYNPGDVFHCNDPVSCETQLREEFAMMRNAGFNSIRLVSMAEGPFVPEEGGPPVLRANGPDRSDMLLPYEDDVVHENYISAVHHLVRIADSEGLKVIVLTTIHEAKPYTRTNFVEIAQALRDDPAVLAFDLFNEPLHFDRPPRTKKSAHDLAEDWRSLARKHAPHHLVTIGLTGIREIHAWDPDILDVDFISFHPYEYEPDQVLNELAWYGRHVRTPWIIGETSLPADGDSIDYEAQRLFAERTLATTVACGGIGYSWWQFEDVSWGQFHSDYMGLWTMEDKEKPTAEVFRDFDPARVTASCELLPNYHNYSEHRETRITGRLLDGTGAPIEGGVVLAWNEHYSHSYHTITHADGRFILYGDMYFYHWIASAIGHDVVRGDLHPASFLTRTDSIPSFNMGDIRISRLPDSFMIH